MKGVENIRDSLGLIITMIVFVVFIGVIFIWSYNFMAVSDTKLFDDENKYIDPTLANPDVEENYKDTYVNKQKFDGLQLNLMNWFSGIKGIFIIAFLVIFLLGLIFSYRKIILENIKNMFD
jgi:predicted PurR-regulated permease PerM